MIDMSAPQGRVAQDFMSRKGYPHIRPHHVETLDGQPCWYFYYQLPEGELELEVFWDGDEWLVAVTAFNLVS